jgi:sulfate permease, SulP family
VLFYRVDAGLFYANTNSVHDLLERLEERETPIDLIVFDLSSSPMVDFASVVVSGGLDCEGTAHDCFG